MNKAIILLFLTISAASAFGSTDRTVISGDRACHAQVYAPNAVVVPEHCLQSKKELIFEGLGQRPIASINPFAGSARGVIDSMVLVELKTPVFENAGRLTLAEPAKGSATVIHGQTVRDCQIIGVDKPSRTFEHTCAGFDGESGLMIYQKGKPVGFHLGLVRSNVAIAAMEEGPRFAASPERFAAYRPQGFKISCCKKIVDAVQNLGDAVASGVDAVKDAAAKAIENVKAEISRVSADIATLPKVFSTQYVQEKAGAIKMPKLPDLRLDDSLLKSGRFKWDLPDIKINTNISLEPSRNSVMGKILTGVTPAIKSVDKGFTDIWHGLDDGISWVLHQLIPDGGTTPQSKCRSDGPNEDKLSCIADLEGQIEAEEAKIYAKRNEFAIWIFQNKSRPDGKQ